MNSRHTALVEAGQGERFPDEASLAALRGWYAGLSARDSVVRYLGSRKATGQSSRAMLSAIRRQLARYAQARQRGDLAALFSHRAADRLGLARAATHAMEVLRHLPLPTPVITDSVEFWLPARTAAALQRAGMRTLVDLTVRVPRRKRWWTAISGLGVVGARRVEG